MLHLFNIIIPGLILLPSVSFAFLSPRNMPVPAEKKEHPLLLAAEMLGRIGTMLLPLFYGVQLDRWYEAAALAGMGLFLLLYYLVWIYYYINGRNFARLFAPLWRIPVPLAVFPSVYFLLSSAILHSVTLLAASLIFGTAHIAISLQAYRRTLRVE